MSSTDPSVQGVEATSPCVVVAADCISNKNEAKEKKLPPSRSRRRKSSKEVYTERRVVNSEERKHVQATEG